MISLLAPLGPGAQLAFHGPAGEHVHLIREVHEAQAVGAHEQDVVLPAEALELFLLLLTFFARLREPRRDEQDVPYSLVQQLLHRGEHGAAPDHDHREIDAALREVFDRGQGPYPRHLGRPGIDGKEPPGHPGALPIADQVAEPLVFRGCAHHGHAAGREKAFQSLVCCLLHTAAPPFCITACSTPSNQSFCQ